MSRGGAERGRHRIGNRLQAPSRQPRARRGARTPRPRDRDLAEVGRLTDCATQAPQFIYFLSERERAQVGEGAEREGDTESEAGSRLQAFSSEPEVRLEPTNREIMT